MSNSDEHCLRMFETGAIIGDGDRKFWDPRAHMIWDNFFYFYNKLRHPYVIYPRESTHMLVALAWMLSRFLIRKILLQIFHSDGTE